MRLLLVFLSFAVSAIGFAAAPNVVLVITDDQGYGDLSCHGNPVLKTPNIDALYEDAVRLTDYHVSPTCSPTRSALLTGHWTNRTGVWHTIMGRSMLRADETTIADVFQASGYATAMFGKWHLGDNHPFRPQDRGFDEVLCHGGGGVGQTPDFWDNAYFDGQYFRNGKPEPADGFCTDVFFDACKDFILEQRKAGKPFFAYLATNAPHGPMHAPVECAAAYDDLPVKLQHFYGMIANIDDNVGRLRRFLDEQALSENTIFIFTTDNGSSSGWKVFNAGMRAGKGSEYDGGHRVPFFIHWPAKKIRGGRDVKPLTAHVDVLPTLIELCELTDPEGVKFDGTSIARLLLDEPSDDWPDRILVTDSQRVKDPIKWRKSAVMTSQWRLINGKELYDVWSDSEQSNDVADRYPDVVKRLTHFYESWWTDLEPSFSKDAKISLGHPDEPVARLTAHDWIMEASPPWNQAHIRKAAGGTKRGYWNVNVHRAGRYEFTLRRWPVEAGASLQQSLPPGDLVTGEKPFRNAAGVGLDIVAGSVAVADQTARASAEKDAEQVQLSLDLPAGPARLWGALELASGDVHGAYYAYVRRVPKSVEP